MDMEGRVKGCVVTAITHHIMGTFTYFKPGEKALCVLHVYVFVSPVLSMGWAWHKKLIVPRP